MFRGWTKESTKGLILLLVFLALIVVMLTPNPNGSSTTDNTTRTTVGVSEDSAKACAAEAIAEYPNDGAQRNGAYNLCLIMQKDYDSQQSQLINGGN